MNDVTLYKILLKLYFFQFSEKSVLTHTTMSKYDINILLLSFVG